MVVIDHSIQITMGHWDTLKHFENCLNNFKKSFKSIIEISSNCWSLFFLHSFTLHSLLLLISLDCSLHLPSLTQSSLQCDRQHTKFIEAIIKYLKLNLLAIQHKLHARKWNWCRFCGCVHICTGLCYWLFKKLRRVSSRV